LQTEKYTLAGAATHIGGGDFNLRYMGHANSSY
jgi:hypothetical protein